MCSMFLPRSSMSTLRPFSVSSLAAHPPEIPDPILVVGWYDFERGLVRGGRGRRPRRNEYGFADRISARYFLRMKTAEIGNTFGNRGAFWAGVVAVIAGVVLHLPMYTEAREMGYRLAGMPVDAPMILGMVLIVTGLAVTIWGLIPRDSSHTLASDVHIRVRALDEVRISPAHVALMLVMAAAVTIDVMKPATLSFVLPGMTREYGLRSPLHPGGTIPAALLPLAGITGTVLGSFLWGWLGDRLGRRPSILMAAMTFIATSICGSMPSFALN